MAGVMLIKSLVQFSVDGWGFVTSLLFTWGQTMVEVVKVMVTSFKRSRAGTATLSAPSPAAGRCRPAPLSETPGHSRASLGQPLVGSLLLSPGPSGRHTAWAHTLAANSTTWVIVSSLVYKLPLL